MKLKKVIKNLEAGRQDCGMIPEDEYTQTIDLATEAIKREVRNRRFKAHIDHSLLPGETKD